MDLSHLYAAAGKALPASTKAEQRAIRLVADACAGLNLDPAEAWKELGPDRDALQRGEISAVEVQAFCLALECSRTRAAGQRPSHYTKRAVCAACGPVWLWEGAPPQVLGCPWCFNRSNGLPIPKPTPATEGGE